MSADPLPGPEAARPGEHAEAFGLLFGGFDPTERDQRVRNALAMLRSGELDPSGLLVLRGRRGLEGAVLCAAVPGAAGLVWPPCVSDGPHRTAGEDALVRSALAWLDERGVKLVQSLLPPHELAAGEPLLRNGFAHITSLWYLRHDLDVPVRHLHARPRLRLLPYGADPERFHETLLRSYEGTLDCPEITGVRTIEEIMAGHRAQGRFDPSRWWLAEHAGRPVGVLLITEPGEPLTWEVAYLGIVPEARRHGYGRELLLHALCEARAAEMRALTLSVDSRNRPARALYTDVGFEPCDVREVFLAIRR